MIDLALELLRDGGTTAALTASNTIRLASDTLQQALSYTPETLSIMMHKLAVVLAAVLPLAVADAPAVLPNITSWSYAGSGCPRTSAVTKTGAGWGELGFEFPASLNAISGTPSGSTKNCLVLLQVADATPGWQVAVESVAITGHATVQPGDKVEYLLTTFWAGLQPTGVRLPPLSRLTGPLPSYTVPAGQANERQTVRDGTTNAESTVLDSPVSYVAAIPTAGLAWSECIGADGSLGILSINLRSITPMSKVGDAHGFLTDKVNFVWRKC